MTNARKNQSCFYKFINGKIKHKKIITRLKENNEVYEDSKEMSEVLIKNFQKVFTTKSNLKKATRTTEEKRDVGNQDK